MGSADVIGTWDNVGGVLRASAKQLPQPTFRDANFPTGYYGHFRSKTRNDILQQYRHEATPLPPQQFIRWVRKSPDTHRFSKHDNKHSFPTDASYFDSGMGRRKANRAMTAFKPELIAWMPHKEEIAREGSAVSLYRLDFRPGGVKSQDFLPQRLSPRIRRKMADMEANDARLKWISDYKKHFCHGQPNVRINTDISTGQVYDGTDHTRSHQYVNKTGKLAKVVPPYLSHLKRRTKSAPPIRYSVGDCLVWNTSSSAPSKRTSIVNDVSKNTDVTPHPPASKRPTESTLSPRLAGCKTTSKMESKGMTPAATAINSFVSLSPTENSKSFELTNDISKVNRSPPTVVVN